MVKNLSAKQETQVRFLGREAPLEEGMAHSSILAWEICGQRGLVGYSPWGHKELDTTERLSNINSSIINDSHCAVYYIRAVPSFSLREGQQCADAMLVRMLGASPGHLEKHVL